METKKITYGGLKKVMSPKEMKNITGGSLVCCRYSNDWPFDIKCHVVTLCVYCDDGWCDNP